jgi:hypothetical protein
VAEDAVQRLLGIGRSRSDAVRRWIVTEREDAALVIVTVVAVRRRRQPAEASKRYENRTGNDPGAGTEPLQHQDPH